MRYILATLLIASLTLPAAAAVGLPYSLTFNSNGTITGTFGGVPVSGTYAATSSSSSGSSGTFTLTVDGKTFATGTYTCSSSGCTLTGTQVVGVSKSFTIITTSTSLSGAALSGSLADLFSTHGAWVSAVAHWAQANLTTMRVGEIVRAAASVQGQSASQQSTGAQQNQGNGQDRGHHGR